ncbi:type VI secretion system baseplate subunit TssF [Aquimarina sp. 2201CG5-10]|uniref:type VI secretion system baseplate subunit TssF n=1 Tax=Aquimarina callyspongiae TaxID=3098150 RepID=UPI002AB4C76E|nr:type VI secretion system baseplate subunit TssF [Aquimarina sp. 2201CG5-10]MDY8138344.1 type VI secretion system baseplate subunit TssF [Aquimarina sp. 2201CG5-10]
MSSETKIQIKNRMIKKAASLWGVSPNEIESSFDPIVSLLIGACASEIEKISGEIDSSQTRVTERLIQLMTPETLYGARPSHAIAYAEPVEKRTNITQEHLLYYKKKIRTQNASHELKNIYFSPVQDCVLIDASITHMLCGNQLYEIEGKRKSNIDLSVINRGTAQPSTLYLGIKTEKDGVLLKDTSLYFEFLDVLKNELFYHHLKNAEFFFEGKLINVVTGYHNSNHSDKAHLESIFDYKPNKTRNIEEQVKKLYQKHFISIKSKVSLRKDGKIPEEFSNFINLDNHDDLEGLNWIKIVFPRIIDDSVLESVYSSFNAFPTLNRKWESISYQLKDYIDIVPVSTQDLFLDVKKVTNTSGKIYKLRENDSSKEHKGTFVVRRDNVSKLDSRKAREYLSHLIELLKDESASFSFFGNDFLQANINELNQNISLLEKKVSDMNKASADTNYISVKPYKKKDTLLVEYWTTNGEEANQIKSGNSLNIYQGSDLKQKGSMFLTSTFQGKNNLSMDERLHAYRRALLSRNRIVTKEDVKALCYELCSNKVEEVKVNKGFKTDIRISKGLIPCIEILLYPNKKVKTMEVEWNALKSNILAILEEQSLNVFPYKLRVMS